MRSFVNQTTSTPEKLNFEAQWLLPKLRRSKEGEIAVVLVGCVDGLDRHLSNYISLGYLLENIHIVEIESETYLALLREVERRKLPCKVVNCDFFDYLDTCVTQGLNVGLADFDGVTTLGPYHFCMAWYVSQQMPRTQLVIIAPARESQTSGVAANMLFEHLGMEKVTRRKYVKVSDRDGDFCPSYQKLMDNQVPTAKAVFEKAFDVVSTFYKGVGSMNMAAFILN